MKLTVIITALYALRVLDRQWIHYLCSQPDQATFSLGLLAFLTMHTPSSGQRNNM